MCLFIASEIILTVFKRFRFEEPEKDMFYHQEINKNTEYYVVHPGHLSFVSLHKGDEFEILDHYGGQACEIACYDLRGSMKPDALELGVPLTAVSVLKENFLNNQSELDQRMESLSLSIKDFVGHRFFNFDSSPGETVNCKNVRDDNVMVLTVPYRKLDVENSDISSEVFVRVTRTENSASVSNKEMMFYLPEALGEVKNEFLVNRRTAQTYQVNAGDYIQIIDVQGRQCSDFIVFSEQALEKGKVNSFDLTTTRSLAGASYPSPGLHSKYFDNDNQALLEVIADTIGRHDTFGLACFPKYYEDLGYPGHLSCTANFNSCLSEYEIPPKNGWPALNLFFNTKVDDHNQLFADEAWSKPGDYVLFQAKQNLLCASSACPDDLSPSNGWDPTDIYVRVYKGNKSLPRGKGYRVQPHSPIKMTKYSAFHSRTSSLTENYAEYNGYWVANDYKNLGAINEYWACREKVVALDLTPLRKFEVTGPDAEELMNRTLTRNIRKLSIGQVVYTAMCYETGGMIDDGTLFRSCHDRFRWVGGSDYGGEWLIKKAREWGLKVWVTPSTEQLHNLSIQGPSSRDVLKKIIWTAKTFPTIEELGWFRFTPARLNDENGTSIVISRTGFTGELGYEIFCHPDNAAEVWDTVFGAGEGYGILPMGFDALDILRIEAGLVIAGNEFCDQTDPFEAGIGFTVPLKTKTDDFIGREALTSRKTHPRKQLIGLKIEGRETALTGDGLYSERCQIGEITSGVYSPVLKKNIALARVDVNYATVETEVEIGKLDGHLKRLKARVTNFPFYDPKKTRVRS